MNKILHYLGIVFVVVFIVSCSEDEKENLGSLTIAFYNVENLFDTVDEPGKNDEEFTPEGDKKWNTDRYQKKLEDLSTVLSSINEMDLPEIIGLCEVENRKVVFDLTQTGKLADGNYNIVHHESRDVRGIDCALIYRSDVFNVETYFPISINFNNESDYKTRDILYVKGEVFSGEEFHIFVNHWPSRIGGNEETEPERVSVATVLRNKIDSITDENIDAKIIIMGDMNDEPSNKSLAEVLGAGEPEKSEGQLFNLMYPDDLLDKGSYSYQGNWNMLDNMIISGSLLDDEGLQCHDKKGFVFHQEWMEYNNNEGEISPNRTFGGNNYYGGVSDHFPVYFKLEQ